MPDQNIFWHEPSSLRLLDVPELSLRYDIPDIRQ